MTNIDLFESTKKILQYRGHVRWANALRVVSEYDDGRMLISGLFPFNLHDEKAPFFKSIAVLLYLPDQPGELARPQFQFALPQKTDSPAPKNETLVYLWEDVPQYYRPGLWEQHLAKVWAAIQEGHRITESRDRTVVADDKLFPEYA